MAIREFEYMHGAVLSRIFRKDEPLQLTLIETNSNEPNFIYKVVSSEQQESILYLKYSKSPKPSKRNGTLSWTFTFSLDNLKYLQKYFDNNVYLGLICAQPNFKSKGTEICILEKDEIFKNIDINAFNPQTFTVTCESNKSLRVRGTMTNIEDIIINRNRIDSISF